MEEKIRYRMGKMTSHEMPPQKPRRKKLLLEVPIHKAKEKGDSGKTYKTYSANFNSKRYKQKLLEVENHEEQTVKSPSKKHLVKENFELSKANDDLVGKFNELEGLSSKKISKLKEKLAGLQNLTADLSEENAQLKESYHELLANFEKLQNCADCENLRKSLEKCSKDNHAIRAENKELNEDINMLKNVVYRLNVQMERYQDKLRKSNPEKLKGLPVLNQPAENLDKPFTVEILSENHRDHLHSPVSWGKVNAHTLGPLLDAYQDTLAEKDNIVQNYETELSVFTGKLKEVLAENEILHSKLIDDDDCSSKLKIELESARKELKTLKDQNDLLIKKCAIKQDKIEEILKCYESKVEQLNRDYRVAHEQFCRSQNENSALREKNKSLVEAQNDFKNERHNYIPVSVHTASVNECKKWYEELKSQYEIEKTKLKDNFEAQLKLVMETNAKLGVVENEKSELENKNKTFEKHVKKLEAKILDLEHNLNEVQLSRSALKKQLHKAMGFAKDLVEEQETLLRTLNQKQKENKVVKRIGSDIASRMDSLKSQLKTVQKDAFQELSTVEERISEQDELIENMKIQHNEEIEKLKLIIQQHENNLILKESNNSVTVPHYLLFRDKHM